MNWPVPKTRLLPALYMTIYFVLPREVALGMMTLWMAVVAFVEFLRMRRPEVGAWVMRREIPPDFFWMTLGIWLMVLVFAGQRVVMVGFGFVALADPLATLAGRRWGKTPWPKNPLKTYEGSIGFFLASAIWALFFVKPVVAVFASAAAAWIEAYPWRTPWRTVFVLPCLGALILSILNMALGGR